MQEKELKVLLNRYKTGSATAVEKAFLESWYLKYQDQAMPEYALSNRLEDARVIWEALQKENRRGRRVILWLRLPVRHAGIAAAVLVFMSFGIYFYLSHSGKPGTAYSSLNTETDIRPGGNKAILTLADGSRISLTDAKNGELARQSGIKITKSADGQIVYELLNISSSSPGRQISSFNTIETPAGGQYQVNLPDGTKVWLNAASSLKFPENFVSLKERRVELSGEAYFEVVPNKAVPFRVTSNTQEVEVLGTHFNMNTYKDEPDSRTTLLEGSVKVKSPLANVILQPGQQAISEKEQGQIKVQEADLEAAMAWKNGYFQFKGETIESIMRKVARWYNVEVFYHKNYTDQGFVGTISRYENVSKVLRKLELTGTVHFKVEGRRITVMP